MRKQTEARMERIVIVMLIILTLVGAGVLGFAIP